MGGFGRSLAQHEAIGEARGTIKGQNMLVQAIEMLKEQKSDEEILAVGIDEHMLTLAKGCL